MQRDALVLTDFLFLTDSYNVALLLRQCVESLLDQLGLKRNPRMVSRRLHM
jgi:hypothetical protein